MADDPTAPETGNPSTPTTPVVDLTTQLPADHPLVKAAAARKAEIADLKRQLADAQNAGKSDADKTNERIEALERELSAAKVTALRAQIAAKYKLDADDAELFLTAADSDGLEAQAKRLAEKVAAGRKGDGVVAGEGSNPKPTSGDAVIRDWAKQVFSDPTT